MAGIRRLFRHARFLHGGWFDGHVLRPDLYHLAWISEGHCKMTEPWVAPSWSWAARDVNITDIHYGVKDKPLEYFRHSSCPQLQCRQEVEACEKAYGTDRSGDPKEQPILLSCPESSCCGRRAGATLFVRSKVKLVPRGSVDDGDESLDESNIELAFADDIGLKLRPGVQIVFWMQTTMESAVPIFIMWTYTQMSPAGDEFRVYGLVVHASPHPCGREHFPRIGSFSTRIRGDGDLFGDVPWREIRLE